MSQRKITTAIVIALTASLFPACQLSGVSVDVVSGCENPAQAKADVVEAVEFFCQERGISDCGRWQHGLRIVVAGVHDPLVRHDCGGYWPTPTDLVEIEWLGGMEKNALFHELLHREMHKDGDPGWSGHSPEFSAEWVRLQKAWGTR